MTSTAWERVRIYSAYERIWHWIQALAVLLLLATGLEARGTWSLLGLETAVRLHQALGFFLLANAALGLFYFLTSGSIRQYVQEPRDFATLAFRQVRYYLRGIFRGEAHPVERGPRARLNPLQKATYVAILNILLPWQVFTGFAIWALGRWPTLEATIGAPALYLPLHAAGSWAFAAFLVAHVYLTTTSGRRPLSGIAAMVTGYEELPRAADAAAEAKP